MKDELDLLGVEPVDAAIYRAAHSYENSATNEKGVAALATVIGSKPAVLNHRVNPTMEDHQLNLKQLKQILMLTNLSPLDALESSFGRVAVNIADKSDYTDTALIECITHLSVEKGEFMKAISDALADGQITHAEMLNIQKEGEDVVRALLEIINRVKSLVVDDDSKVVSIKSKNDVS